MKNHSEDLKILFENLPDAAAITDINGNFLFVNPAYSELTGYTSDELLQKSCFDLTHKDDMEKSLKSLQEVFEKKKVAGLKKRCRHKDGHFIFVELNISLYKQDKVIFSARNISESEKNKESLELFRKLIDIIDDGVFIIDANSSRFLDVNRSAHEKLGYTKDEMLNMSVIDISSMDTDINEWKNNIYQVQQKSKFVRFRDYNKKKDGSWLPVEVSFGFNQKEGENFIIVTTRSIEELVVEEKKREAQFIELLKQYGLMQKLMDNIPASIFIKDSNNKFILVNKAFAKLNGKNKGDFVGKDNIEALGNIEPFISLNKRDLEMINSGAGRFDDNSIEIVDESGKTHYFNTTWIVTNSDEELKDRMLIMISYDTTELILAQKEIEESKRLMLFQSRQAAMGEMLNMIAHQWRQPLNSIGLMLYNLVSSVQDSANKEDIQRRYEDIKSHINGLSQTIDVFRNFFRNDIKESNFCIKNTCEKLTTLYKDVLSAKGVELELNLHEAGCIVGKEGELSQVLANLINNATDEFKDSSVANPKITIETRVKDDNIELIISDNGKGVSKDIKDKIFDPYFSTKGEHGSGIGLYMSKKIIKEHFRGEIYLSDMDVGAQFVVVIPREKK